MIFRGEKLKLCKELNDYIARVIREMCWQRSENFESIVQIVFKILFQIN